MSQYKYNKYERETIIIGNDAEPTVNISTYQAVWIRRLLRLAERCPDDVKIIKQTDDYIEVDVPKRFLKVSPPRFVSEEQREASRKRLQEYRLRKSQNNSLSSDELADMQAIEEDLDDAEETEN